MASAGPRSSGGFPSCANGRDETCRKAAAWHFRTVAADFAGEQRNILQNKEAELADSFLDRSRDMLDSVRGCCRSRKPPLT